MSLKIASGAGA